jgi:hypothetical protein
MQAGGGGRAAAAGGTAPPPDVLFECPDGRLGLHVVHTRVLIQQPRVNLVFVASRIQLMKTFMIPNLNAQTTQNFVLYASYDSRLKPSTLRAFSDALDLVNAHTLVNAERATSMQLNYTQLARRLAAHDPRVHDVQLFVTSRIDIDDATHVQSVEAVQRFACEGGAGAPKVRVAYVQGGQLWFPSTSPRAVYGMAGVWKHLAWDNALYRVLAIMQVRECAQRFRVRAPPA